jgi:hypothetical protein
VCAGLASASGDWLLAARFFGVAEECREQTGLRRDPPDEAFLEPLIDRARRALAAEVFLESMNEGRAIPLEEALVQAGVWLSTRARPH